MDDKDTLARQRTDLAIQRTIFAAERTLMAWVRTAISMIGFGFSIHTFFRYLREAAGFAHTQPLRPRNLGLTLVAFGTLFLILATLENWGLLRKFGIKPQRLLRSPAFLMALLMVIMGIIVFVNMFFGGGPF